MTTTTSSSATTTPAGSAINPPAAGAPTGPGGPPPLAVPSVRQRRNPRLAALGAVLLTVGGLAGAYLFTQGGQTESVVALKAPITAGQQITAEQVGTAQLPANTGLNSIPGADIDTIIGKYANASLPAGALLSPENVQPTLFPPAGKSVVGVALKPSQEPARGLLPGDSVRLVVTATSGAAGAAPGEGDQTGTTWAATVLTSGARSDDGTTTVDFVIDTATSTNLAAAAGAGNVAVILDPLKKG